MARGQSAQQDPRGSVQGRKRRNDHPDAGQNPDRYPLAAQRSWPHHAVHGEESARSRERKSATSPIPKANSPASPATPTITSRCLSPATGKQSQPCNKRQAQTFSCFRLRVSWEVRRTRQPHRIKILSRLAGRTMAAFSSMTVRICCEWQGMASGGRPS